MHNNEEVISSLEFETGPESAGSQGSFVKAVVGPDPFMVRIPNSAPQGDILNSGIFTYKLRLRTTVARNVRIIL